MMSEARAPSDIRRHIGASTPMPAHTGSAHPMRPIVKSLAHIDACETSARC
jgi:hypothetical protein